LPFSCSLLAHVVKNVHYARAQCLTGPMLAGCICIDDSAYTCILYLGTRPARTNHSVAIPITMEALCFQERKILNTLSVDYHERGTDYQDGAEPLFRDRSP
jgi:hypothetical protein